MTRPVSGVTKKCT